MNEVEKSEFAKSLLQGTYDLEALKPIDQVSALKFLESEIEDLLELNNPAMLSKRNNWLKIPGTSDQNFLERVFEIGNRRSFLAGIRHVGGNPSMPFVNLTADFTPSSWAEFDDIKNIVRSEFKIFNPAHIAIWFSPRSSFALEIERTIQPARRYLAAKTAELLSKSPPPNFNSLHLEAVKAPDYFDWYKNEYEKFHVKHPELKSWVTMSDFEDLEEYRALNLLYRAKMGEETVGLIGGSAQSLLGMSGLYMCELLIAETFKGKSLAAAMQRRFIEEAGRNFEVVWGTIDSRNIPSTRTALKIGRHIVRNEYFIPLR
jgi:RimJ/RimL family protein N-acetyltransferase